MGCASVIRVNGMMFMKSRWRIMHRKKKRKLYHLENPHTHTCTLLKMFDIWHFYDKARLVKCHVVLRKDLMIFMT